MAITLIGIDCSTNIRRNGLARGNFQNSNLVVTDLLLGSNECDFISLISSWISAADQTLLCLDAPLGWPDAFGESLANHQAGKYISESPNNLFRRQTDKMIKRKLGKQPLDVGSNFIARTAHYALRLIEHISKEVGEDIPLAWTPILKNKASAIEVYPAATLLAHNIPHAGYKRDDLVRQKLIAQLHERINFECETGLMVEKDDVFDAVLCVLAGADFLRDQCIPPKDRNKAEKEGWIWVLDRD